MKILVAVENVTVRWWLQAELMEQGNAVLAVGDGLAAWEAILSPDPPQIVLLDRELPVLSGLEVCRKARGTTLREQPYIIFLVEASSPEEAASADQVGGDDYLRKPLDVNELAARIRVGRRVMQLQAQVTANNEELCNSLLEPAQPAGNTPDPHGLLPMCAWCKEVRSDDVGWRPLERYLVEQGVEVSHGICPECMSQMLTEARALPQECHSPHHHHLKAS